MSAYDFKNNLNVHVALDNTVIIDDIKMTSKMQAASNRDKSRNPDQNCDATTEEEEKEPDWSPLLLFIPPRLGLTDINPLYFPDLKARFKKSDGDCCRF